MEVITSHINLDFDGFASMVAAQKLYPDAQLVLPNVISKEVRNFLALYRSSFELKDYNEIDVALITKLIIADASSSNRVIDFLGELKKDVPIMIYDHHIEKQNLINSQSSIIKNYGACVTILVREIIEKHIEIKPFEATIFLLGIYSDTNCLTSTSTKVEDVEVLAYLLNKGAYLDVVSIFIEQPFSSIQRNAFDNILNQISDYFINGFDIGICKLKFNDYIDELSYLTNKVLSIKDYDAIFVIAKMKSRTYIVGRSTVARIDIGDIMKCFGGAGHPRAGSAIMKESDLDNIQDELISILKNNITPSITAKDILSYPVKTVSSNTTLNEVEQIMLRYGHSGIPVVDEDRVVGIATRKDIEKAIHHGYGHSPIKAYMSRKVISILPNTPIKEIQHKMVENNIGRLLVIENQRIIGIVTRTDILRQIYGEDSPNKQQKIYTESDRKNLKKNLSNEINNNLMPIKEVLCAVGQICDHLGYSAYVVGGFVRDLLLGINNLDIDIVIVGDAIKVAKKLGTIHNAKVKIYDKFQTASITVHEYYKIDIVTARREFYEYPAALPTVEEGSIKSDLYRRDFTINSMAVSLNKKHFGKIVDYFGGQKDLQDKFIRVLYNMSFIEDPTRIFRAIKFEQRLEFKLEEQTLEYLQKAVNVGVLDKVSNERLTDELIQILNEGKRGQILLRLNQLDILSKIYPKLIINQEIINNIIETQKIFSNIKCDILLINLLLLFSKTSLEDINELLTKIKLKKYYKDCIIRFTKNKNILLEKLNFEGLTKYQIYKLLKGLSYEEVLVLELIGPQKASKNISLFMGIMDINISIDGNLINELGLKPGPLYKKILDKVTEAKVNGLIHTKEDEISMVKELLKGGI